MGFSTITERPWGTYEVLLDAPNVKVKRIVVKNGKRLSLQSHQKREERWVIVSGSGIFTRGMTLEYLNEEIVNAGDSVLIPKTYIHRIEAFRGDLTFIEVQLGDSFEESDIERFEDDFGRS